MHQNCSPLTPPIHKKMDGRRGIRVEGTDGNDFDHRQKVDNRYQKLASAKSFIQTTGVISILAGLYTFIGSFIDSSVIGMDLGIVGPLIFSGLAGVIYLLSTKVSSSVVDVGIVALHKLMVNFMMLSSVGILMSIGYEIVIQKNFGEIFLMFFSIPIFAFVALISHRSAQADDEIINALETKKGKGNKRQ